MILQGLITTIYAAIGLYVQFQRPTQITNYLSFLLAIGLLILFAGLAFRKRRAAS